MNTLNDAEQSRENARGLILMLSGFALFSCSDAIAKVLTADFHAVQVVFLRQFGLIGGLLVLLSMHGRTILKSNTPVWQVLRGGVAVISATCFVMAVSQVPLADAVAVSFVAPFMVTVLGAVFLREPVGARRWAAVLVGFFGALIIIRPGFAVFHPAIFLVVLAALAFAMRQIISRKIGSRDSTYTTVAYTGLVSVALLGTVVPFVWQWPNGVKEVMLLFALAFFAGCGEILMITALEKAHAVVLAPAHYALILFSTFWGFVVFGQFPDFWTWVGSAVIILSGVYTLARERKRARLHRGPATPAA